MNEQHAGLAGIPPTAEIDVAIVHDHRTLLTRCFYRLEKPLRYAGRSLFVPACHDYRDPNRFR